MIGRVPYALSLQCQVRNMSSEMYCLLAHTLCIRFPATPVHCWSDHAIAPNSLPLTHTVIFFEYVVVDSKRFYTSWTVSWNRSSLVHVVIPGPFPKDTYSEVVKILQIDQDFWNTGHLLWVARVQWLKPWDRERDNIWDDSWVPGLHPVNSDPYSIVLHPSAHVNVCLWALEEYQGQDADFSAFINPEWINGHLTMTMVSIGQNRTKVWATVGLAKVRILHIATDLIYDLRLWWFSYSTIGN